MRSLTPRHGCSARRSLRKAKLRATAPSLGSREPFPIALRKQFLFGAGERSLLHEAEAELTGSVLVGGRCVPV